MEQTPAAAWFVVPETVRLELSDGIWIRINVELSVAQARRVQKAIAEDSSMNGLAQIVEYLVEWNVPGPDGEVLEIGERDELVDILGGMRVARYNEIDAAILEHMKARFKADDQKKTIPSGKKKSRPTSSSAV